VHPSSPQRSSTALSLTLTAVLVVLAAATPSAAAAPAAPPVATGRLIQLNSLGGQGSFGTTMNERGDIIGASIDAADNYKAVVWWHGRRSPTDLGITGGRAGAINEKGHIAGYVEGGLFLWRAGAVTYLRRGAAASFGAVAINDKDQVAGTETDQNDVSRAFLWHRGRLTMLPTPKGMSSRAVGINNRGQVVGTVTGPDAAERAVLWQHGRMIRLGTLGGAGSVPVAINELGQVIGNSTVAGSSDEHPFLWQRGRMTDLLAGTNATSGRVTALNDTGTATGYATLGDQNNRPVLWRAGRLTVIGLPGHTGIGAHINDRGDVTGPTWADPQSLAVPFRWRNGHTTLYPEPATDIATTVIGIDRRGAIGVDQETSLLGNILLRSA
jgi:probable HAF family extracellular repeat protein